MMKRSGVKKEKEKRNRIETDRLGNGGEIGVETGGKPNSSRERKVDLKPRRKRRQEEKENGADADEYRPKKESK